MTLNVKRRRLGGAVYILPNLITTGNLFFGFFSIVKCLQGDFEWAASAILLAAVFDVLDGRVARMTGGTSEFGVQYDSLCDLVSFGVAPAFLMYQAALNHLGRPGWIICFLFLACGALRLARFNVQSAIGKASGDFAGLPIPMAASVVACYMALAVDLKEQDSGSAMMNWLTSFLNDDKTRTIFFAVAGVGLAMAMVSNITYRSHKAFKFSKIKPFKILVFLVILTGLVAYRPAIIGFLFFTLYALSGPFEWLIGWKKPVEDDDIFETESEDHIMEPKADDD